MTERKEKKEKKTVTRELSFEDARELAKGDIACFLEFQGKYDLKNVINATSKWLSVLPHQVWRKDDPAAWNQFYLYEPLVAQRWEGMNLKHKGYKAVRVGPTGDFDCDYEFFDLDPEEDQVLVIAGHTVYARPGELYLKDREKDLGIGEQKQASEWDQNYADAERLGLGAFEIKDGERKMVVQPSQKLYSS